MVWRHRLPKQHPDESRTDASAATFLTERCRRLCRDMPDAQRTSTCAQALEEIAVLPSRRIAVGEGRLRNPATDGERSFTLQSKHSTLTIIKAGRHLTPLEKPDEIAAQLGIGGADRAMKFQGEIQVPAPREAVFDKINDPVFFASCIEGVQDMTEVDPDHFTATPSRPGSPTSVQGCGDG